MSGVVRWFYILFVCPWIGHDWTGTGKEQGKHCRRCGAWEYDRRLLPGFPAALPVRWPPA